ncbi:hypothetical protein APED_30960 [Acanthopleuribacter pedis]
MYRLDTPIRKKANAGKSQGRRKRKPRKHDPTATRVKSARPKSARLIQLVKDRKLVWSNQFPTECYSSFNQILTTHWYLSPVCKKQHASIFVIHQNGAPPSSSTNVLFLSFRFRSPRARRHMGLISFPPVFGHGDLFGLREPVRPHVFTPRGDPCFISLRPSFF